MPNTSSSVPFLLSSSMNSIRSRRPSACLSSSQGSGLLQQLGSGMVRQLSHQQVNGRAFPGCNVRQCPSPHHFTHYINRPSLDSPLFSLCLTLTPLSMLPSAHYVVYLYTCTLQLIYL